MTRVFVIRCFEWNEDEPFEPIVSLVEEHMVGVEILSPGLVAFEAKGATSYYGSESLAAERIVEAVATEFDVEALAGVADTLFAAYLASGKGTIVPSGETKQFLRQFDIGCIGRVELTSALDRLGIHTLGSFADLPVDAVADQFGSDALAMHRLVHGEDSRPLVPRVIPTELSVSIECDPPLKRLDVAAFTARALAVQLGRVLEAHGLACSRVVIDAEMMDGQRVSRTWSQDGPMSDQAISNRVRWQLEGWIAYKTTKAGVSALSLTPQGLMSQHQAQPGLWGTEG